MTTDILMSYVSKDVPFVDDKPARALMSSFLYHGQAQCLAWVLEKHREALKDVGTMEVLHSFANATGIPYTRVHYAFFEAKRESCRDLKKREEFGIVQELLYSRLKDLDFWGGFLPFTYRSAKLVAIELLVFEGVEPYDISCRLNVSTSVVYRVRKDCLKRAIQKRGG